MAAGRCRRPHKKQTHQYTQTTTNQLLHTNTHPNPPQKTYLLQSHSQLSYLGSDVCCQIMTEPTVSAKATAPQRIIEAHLHACCTLLRTSATLAQGQALGMLHMHAGVWSVCCSASCAAPHVLVYVTGTTAGMGSRGTHTQQPKHTNRCAAYASTSAGQ